MSEQLDEENESDDLRELVSGTESEDEDDLCAKSSYRLDNISNAHMLEKLKDLQSQFTSLLEQVKTSDKDGRAGRARKTARQSLDFDSPIRKRGSPSLRQARLQVPDSPDASELSPRDSVQSQSSSRIRLQERYRFIEEKSTESNNPEMIKDWIRRRCTQVMADSGNSYDHTSVDADYGGFKPVQVPPLFFSNFYPLSHRLYRFSQNYRSMSKKTSGFESLQLHCPFRHKCNCYVAIKLMKYPDKTVMMQAGDHTCESHVGKQRGVLTVKQRGAVVRAARAAPLSVGRQVHDGLLDDSPGKRVPFDKRSQSAVNRLVRKVRGQVMEERLGPGIDVDGTEGSMNRLAESLSLAAFIKRHNDPEDEFHISPFVSAINSETESSS